MFLVGGRGTRLGSLSARTPKSLLPVAGRPFLDYLITEALRHGFRQILLLTGYLANQVQAYAKRWRDQGVDIRCVVEPEPAGTGGALHMASPFLDEKFLLINGDSLFAINFLDLLTIAPLDPWLVKIALRSLGDAGRYGRVDLDGERVEAFDEKGRAGPGTINGGVYLLNRGILDQLPTAPCSIERDVFPVLAACGLVSGRVYDAPFIDIGIPQDYRRAQTFVPTLLNRPALFLDMDEVVEEQQKESGPPDLILRSDAREIIKAVNDHGSLVILLMGRRARHLGPEGTFTPDASLRALNEGLQVFGAHIDAAYEWADEMETEPVVSGGGTIALAMMQWNVNPEGSLLASTNPTALKAAERAGLPGIAVLEGKLAQCLEESPYWKRRDI